MSINLKQDCKDCVHEKVCRNIGRPEAFKKRIESMNYGNGPNDDYDFGTMSDHYHVKIDVSCKDFEKNIARPRTDHDFGFDCK